MNSKGKQTQEMEVSTVHFNEISSEIVQKVVEKGEIFSSAGGFSVEDMDLNPLIRDVEGSVDSVMGMPIEVTIRIIKALNI
jgi:septum formation protein